MYINVLLLLFKVNILESNKNQNSEITVPIVSDTKVTYDVNYGGNYFIRVSTITPNAIPSPLINYRAPELPPPHQVKVFNRPDSHYEIYWQKPSLPPKLHSS